MNLKTRLYKLLLLILSITSANAYAQNAACPDNLDFEDGNLNNWEFFIGNCCPAIANTPTAPIPGRHELTSGSGVDYYGQFPVVAPGGGNYSFKLGNNSAGAQAEKARYYVHVPSNPNKIYTVLYHYAVVFEDPNHPAAAQPRFEVNAYDSATGQPIPCNQFTFVSGSGLPGFKKSTKSSSTVWYKDWTTSSIDLSSMAGHTVTLDFITGDCGYGAHFGYAYIDVECNFFQSYDIFCATTTTSTLTAPPGFETYEWWDASFSNKIGVTENITIPTPTFTTKFAVILQPYTGFGCPDTLFTAFNVNVMSIDVTLDTGICRGESVHLSSGTNSTKGPYTYSWSPSTGLSCNKCDSPIASPAALTKYYITVTDHDGCTAVDSVLVRVDDNVFADLVVGDTFCAGEPIAVNNKPKNPATSQYLWNIKADGGVISYGDFTDSITAQWYAYGQKKVKLSVVNGLCKAADSAEVYINPSPVASFDYPKNVCVGTPVRITMVQQNASYHWSIEGQSVPDTNYQEKIDLVWSSAGKKKIYLKTNNAYNCISEKEAYIGIHEYPTPTIIPVDITDICYGKQFKLATNDSPRYQYSWYPPQFFSSNGQAEVTGTAERTGYVYLDVTNEWHCTSTDSIYIRADACCDIFAPDAFSPNNDGVNDTYYPPDLYKHQLVNFIIANRRGQIVYQTTVADNKGWDGTYKGQPAGMDTYNYYIKYLCKQKQVVEKKGTFLLIR